MSDWQEFIYYGKNTISYELEILNTDQMSAHHMASYGRGPIL